MVCCLCCVVFVCVVIVCLCGPCGMLCDGVGYVFCNVFVFVRVFLFNCVCVARVLY